MSLFTEDASRVVQDCPIQQGKAAIRAFQGPLMDKLRTVGIADNAFDITYTVDPSQQNGSPGLVTTFTKQTFHLSTGACHVTYHMLALKRGGPQNDSEWKIQHYIACTVKDQPLSEQIKDMV